MRSWRSYYGIHLRQWFIWNVEVPVFFLGKSPLISAHFIFVPHLRTICKPVRRVATRTLPQHERWARTIRHHPPIHPPRARRRVSDKGIRWLGWNMGRNACARIPSPSRRTEALWLALAIVTWRAVGIAARHVVLDIGFLYIPTRRPPLPLPPPRRRPRPRHPRRPGQVLDATEIAITACLRPTARLAAP